MLTPNPVSRICIISKAVKCHTGPILKDAVIKAMSELDIPEGWYVAYNEATVVIRPRTKALPMIKACTTPLRVYVDIGKGIKITSTKHDYTTVAEMRTSVQALIYQFNQ